MARIQRRIRGAIVPGDVTRLDAEGAELFADVAVLQLDAGLVIVGTAADYPDHPPHPRHRSFRIVAHVDSARLDAQAADFETYSDLDGNVFTVRKRTHKAFCCGSKFRDLPGML